MALVRPVTNGTISASSALGLANVPSAVASGLVWPRPVSGDVLFSKFSKLLNQEDALSAPFGLHQSRN